MEWRCAVTNVLCALEHTEREAGEEVTGRQQTSRWAESESGVLLQKLVHILELRDLVSSEYVVVLQHLESVPVFHAEVFGHQVQNVVENCGPCTDFVSSIFNDWDQVTTVIIKKHDTNVVKKNRYKQLYNYINKRK